MAVMEYKHKSAEGNVLITIHLDHTHANMIDLNSASGLFQHKAYTLVGDAKFLLLYE